MAACYVICTWKRFAVAVQSCLADTVVGQPPAPTTRRAANPSVRTSCLILSWLVSSITEQSVNSSLH